MSKQKFPNINDFPAGFAGFTTEIVINNSSSISENEMVLNLTNGIQFVNKGIKGKSVVKKITSAQLLALNATPVEVIPACGDGYFNQVTSWSARHGTGTAYAGIAAGEDLALKYTNGSGAIAATVIESTGFLDQVTAQLRAANGLAGNGAAASTPGDYVPVNNAAIVIQMLSGEITTGNFDLYLFINYDIIPSDYTI